MTYIVSSGTLNSYYTIPLEMCHFLLVVVNRCINCSFVDLLEVVTEADSNDSNSCSHDDKQNSCMSVFLI